MTYTNKLQIDSAWLELLADLPTDRKRINLLKKSKEDMEYDLDLVKPNGWLHGNRLTERDCMLYKHELSVINGHLDKLKMVSTATKYYIKDDNTSAIAVTNKGIRHRSILRNGSIREVKLPYSENLVKYLLGKGMKPCNYNDFLTLKTLNL